MVGIIIIEGFVEKSDIITAELTYHYSFEEMFSYEVGFSGTFQCVKEFHYRYFRCTYSGYEI